MRKCFKRATLQIKIGIWPERSLIMTKDIKGKVKELYNEILFAKKEVEDIIKTLKTCKDTTKLSEEVGFHARHMPKLKILAEQRRAYISVIRQVCTLEITVDEALILIKLSALILNGKVSKIVKDNDIR